MVDQPAGIPVPAHRLRRGAGQRPALGVSALRGIERQGVLDVRQQQFLVLLLMLQAQGDQVGQRSVITAFGQHGLHPLVNGSAVVQHPGQTGPTDQAALGPRVPGANAVVIAVVKHPKAGIKGFEAGFVLLQHKGFKKPGQVRQMPFGGAGVGHGLQLAVLGAERCGQPFGLPAYVGKTLGQFARNGRQQRGRLSVHENS